MESIALARGINSAANNSPASTRQPRDCLDRLRVQASNMPARYLARPILRHPYSPSTYEKISGATIDASELIMNRGVLASSLFQVIFSFGSAPE